MRRSILAALCVVFTGGITAGLRAQSLVDTPFSRQAEKNFALWDSDRDGVVSELEVNAAISDPRFTTESAAALAALKTALRNAKKSAIPPFDRKHFAQYARSPVARKATVTASVSDGETGDPAGTGAGAADVSPPFDTFYQRGLNRLRTTGPDVFLANDPRLDHIRQRAESDCFFLAVVGAMIHREPSTLRGLIAAQRDGSCRVAFPGRPPMRIAPLTDTQICLYESTSSGARWLMVLEEAYGRATNEQRPEFARRAVASDYYLVGGSPGACIRLLTGHEAQDWYLRERGSMAMPTPEEAQPKLAALRNTLTDAFGEHRLVTASTNTGALPPGITSRHAYAVLGYDARTNTVQLWNPHRNNLRPRGAAGLETGYPTREGIFSVSLTDFACIFARLTWEKKA